MTKENSETMIPDEPEGLIGRHPLMQPHISMHEWVYHKGNNRQVMMVYHGWKHQVYMPPTMYHLILNGYDLEHYGKCIQKAYQVDGSMMKLDRKALDLKLDLDQDKYRPMYTQDFKQ